MPIDLHDHINQWEVERLVLISMQSSLLSPKVYTKHKFVNLVPCKHSPGFQELMYVDERIAPDFLSSNSCVL